VPAMCLNHVRLPDVVRRVEFVSDLHLCADMPHTAAAFLRYLAGTQADAVFLLGDVFEAWIGDDAISSLDFERQCVQAMASLAQRAQLFVMCGNRDFLLGTGFLQASAATGLNDPSSLDAFGQRLLLSHGDALCTADTAYQQVRQVLRDPAWQADFLARPLPARQAAARAMRAQSQAQQAELAPGAYADVDATLATQWLVDAGANTLVHGHTHRPGSETWPGGYTRHVLSDWDLDSPQATHAQVLGWTASGFTRHAFV